MKVIIPCNSKGELNSLDYVKNAIFLAGPCPRVNYDDDWRNEAIEYLEDIGFDGIVLNPTNRNYNKGNFNLEKQTKWEVLAMHYASAIVFWIPRSKEHPAFTTNIELGQWINSPSVYLGFPIDSWKNEYIKERCHLIDKPIFNDLRELLNAVVTDLKSENTYFTSDTHFGQERTLELSKRPFRTVEDMDMVMISNWNKRVSPESTVYHLGDFGNLEYLNLLNFKELNIISGNYERDNDGTLKEDVIRIVTDYNSNHANKVNLYDTDLEFLNNGLSYKLQHEPIKGILSSKNDFFLYGHIHGRQMYKINGLDVGVDCHGYSPISIEEVEWRRNAILNYCDENVFTDYCSGV